VLSTRPIGRLRAEDLNKKSAPQEIPFARRHGNLAILLDVVTVLQVISEATQRRREWNVYQQQRTRRIL